MVGYHYSPGHYINVLCNCMHSTIKTFIRLVMTLWLANLFFGTNRTACVCVYVYTCICIYVYISVSIYMLYVYTCIYYIYYIYIVCVCMYRVIILIVSSTSYVLIGSYPSE